MPDPDCAEILADGFERRRAFGFCFEGREALYRDHKGERVLADLEGSGFFKLVASNQIMDVTLDGVAHAKSSGQFCESLLVTSKDLGRVEVSVLMGGAHLKWDGNPSASRTARMRTAGMRTAGMRTDFFEGCGWILAADRVDQIDGVFSDSVASNWDAALKTYPLPVFREASGKNLRVEPVPYRVETLAHLSFDVPGSLKSQGWQAKNCSKVASLAARMKGGTNLEAQHVSHLNEAGFRFFKPDRCIGVVVRKLYDAFHGRQRARVLLDGRFVGWWFEPVEDRNERWRWGQFGFPTEKEARDCRFGVDPAAGTPLWSVAAYEVWGLFPQDSSPKEGAPA